MEGKPMKQLRHLPLLAAIVSLACTFAVSRILASGQNDVWPGLESGPHQVGYTVKHLYDQSRTFKRPTDYTGTTVEGSIARPLQISIWYPAAPAAVAAPMKYEEYLRAETTETVFDPPDEAQIQASIDRTLRFMAMEWGVERDRLEAVISVLKGRMDQPAGAFRDAPRAEDQFPLILHMSGYNAAPSHHAGLFEYLAGHGYIVAALPSMGMYSGNIDNELLSIEVQARDLEFATGYMRDIPGVDTERIGTTGMSWGGMSNVLFAQRNYYVDAVVTLDGAITMPVELDLIESLPGFAARTFYPAYMQLLVEPNDAKFRPKELRFFEGLIYSDAYSVQFNDVVHDDFGCETVRLRNLVERDSDMAAYREAFLRALHRYVLGFFNAYLKDDQTELAFVQTASEAGGMPSGLIESHEYKKAAPIPPTQAEFQAIIREQGAVRAGEVYRAAIAVDSDVELSLASRQMGPLFMEAFQTAEYEKALEICTLWLEGNPDQVGPYFSMARIYRQTGKKSKAIECYRKILELAPNGRSADNARQALAELEQ
jgi:tetratricopeptide (TPR) repeat protein